MNYFVTGATGFIGAALVKKLAHSGHRIHALYRSQPKTSVINLSQVRLFKGDLLDAQSLHKAMKGCDGVFHTAAQTKIWTKNPDFYSRVNITGTQNVLQAALDQGVKKAVVTSTAGVFGPSSNSEVHEQTIRNTRFFTEYEKTKKEADSLALEYSKKGMGVVLVYPTRVYGPGPLEQSNSVAKIIRLYLKGQWRIIPGKGNSLGNYVFIDDVVNGHILAMVKGLDKEKYILGGENVSYNRLFDTIKKASQENTYMFHVSPLLLKAISHFLEWLAWVFPFEPWITAEMVEKLSQNWPVSSKKACQELGYKSIPLEEGLKKTIIWLQNQQKSHHDKT
ncbi:MAG: NAD-dependent epimerase/dehydratase family protein [Candidatus Aminicenantes bacterium]|nr:NAD-dependent epimerase/dehydratase family protein [Candidatus Aminicenantes bacterium]